MSERDFATLTHEEARRFYDRLGSGQDRQAAYEDRATRAMRAPLRLPEARAVLEFGCGTGRLAAEILSAELPADATYLGLDQSTTMVDLARERVARFGERARVVQTDGSPKLVAEGGSVDRVLSTYVLDLLSTADIQSFLVEAHRVLVPGGLLGLVSLGFGCTGPARLFIGVWSRLHRLSPRLVGGCRPLDLVRHLEPARWEVLHLETVTALGLVPSEVLVARRL